MIEADIKTLEQEIMSLLADVTGSNGDRPMTTPTDRPARSTARAAPIRELLAGRKYSIDYYQREYKWQQKQVAELIDDLAAKFLESHEEGNERSAVADYGHYFLGSIIVSDKDGQKFIIDGQQRLTTLTLLLIFLQHQLDGRRAEGPDRRAHLLAEVRQALVQPRHPGAHACMEALYAGEEFADADAPESVANILARYADIEELFPEELPGRGAAVLRGLADRERAPGRDHRLLRRRRLHDLRDHERPRAFAHARGHAQGLPARQHHRRRPAHAREPRLEGARQALAELGKDEDADGIKSWLRSQYAESIRERKRGAAPQDFDLIGTEFHRWVRDHEERLGLTASAEFARFIERDFAFYSRWYERLRRAARRSRRASSASTSTPSTTSRSSTRCCSRR